MIAMQQPFQKPLSPSSPLTRLIWDVEDIFAEVRGPEATASRIAAALQCYLGDPGLLTPEQSAPDPSGYRQNILHVDAEERFSIVALIWAPGQATAIHDHLSWCVFGVHQGEEHEVQYREVMTRDGLRLVPTAECINPEGMVEALIPPGDIHRVLNAGDRTAISLHIYGVNVARVGSSIRRRYDHPILPGGPKREPLEHAKIRAFHKARGARDAGEATAS
jgi:3-mercaptopropionate dioxygenase